MILLDTNVVSEAMRTSPDMRVIRWLDALPETDVWTSAISVAEIRLGIALLPDGKHRTLLAELAEKMFHEDFSDQCLPFDCDAAQAYPDCDGTQSARPSDYSRGCPNRCGCPDRRTKSGNS